MACILIDTSWFSEVILDEWVHNSCFFFIFQVLDLEKRIKQEQEEDSKLPPPSKAIKAAKDRERKKRAEKGQNKSRGVDDESDDDQPTPKKQKKSDWNVLSDMLFLSCIILLHLQLIVF